MEEFIIGNLVVAKGHPNLTDNNVYFNSRIEYLQDDVPVMVIKEVNYNSKRDDRFNSQFGKEIGAVKDEDKYLCSWYDNELGAFKDKFFYRNQIELIPVKSKRFTLASLPKIGTRVNLATIELESFKVYGKNVNKTFRFKSPLMVILDYKRIDEPTLFDPKTGKKTKVCDEINVKCQWFNSKSGKYSEEWLPLSTLCSTDFINKMPFEHLIDEDIKVCEKIEVDNSLFISTMQSVEHVLGIRENTDRFFMQKGEGRKQEWTTFHSNAKVVLNPKFHELVKQKGWNIDHAKVFVNIGQEYGQVDVIAKKDDRVIIIDVIKSFAVNEGDAVKWQNGDSLDADNKTKKILDKYWNRIVKHKEMLNDNKYNKDVLSCYLLLEFFVNNMLKVIVLDKNESAVSITQTLPEPAEAANNID